MEKCIHCHQLPDRGTACCREYDGQVYEDKTKSEKQAIHVATGIKGLSFTFGSDGVWMNTSSNGKHTSLNLSNYGKEGGGITTGLLEWCKETAKYYNADQ